MSEIVYQPNYEVIFDDNTYLFAQGTLKVDELEIYFRFKYGCLEFANSTSLADLDFDCSWEIPRHKIAAELVIQAWHEKYWALWIGEEHRKPKTKQELQNHLLTLGI
jgi:hypothetical protein